jgi:hypothetical protein
MLLWEEKKKNTSLVISHIESERPEPGPYKCMLTLTSKTRFGAMRSYQEQTREEDFGWKPWKWVDWEAQSGQYLASGVGCYKSNICLLIAYNAAQWS